MTEPQNYNTFAIPVDVSYEADLWGRVRRTVEASRSEAQATAADLANVSLSLHAELASDYFLLRGLDAQKQLLDSTVESYEKALELTENRYHGGLASAVDVAQAQTTLETTRAQSVDVGVQSAAYEHAIAVLVGKPASQFIDRDASAHERRRQSCRQACPPTCSNAAPIFPPRKGACRSRTPRSVSPVRHIFRW